MKPMAHQRASLAHDATHPIVYDTSEPGTGKTAVRIWGYAARHKKDGKRALVLAPRSLLHAVWASDIRKFAPHLRASIAWANNREAAFAANADIYITNHDAAKWLAKQSAAWFRKMNFGELIIDESTAYKHHTSARSRAMRRIVRHFKQRKGLTGTPNTVSILDIWHQVLLLDDGARLGQSYYSFRDACCTPKAIGIRNLAHWEDKEGIEAVVFGQIGDIVIRHLLDDCADIPPNHHHSIAYAMPRAQQRVFDDLQARQILPFKGAQITAVNAAALATKLLQVASGAVYTEGEQYTVVDPGRYALVMDLAQERKQPLIYFLWKHQRDLLAQEARQRGLNYAIVDGDASDATRAEIQTRYQHGLIDGIIAHPKTMAHGFTLTAGTSTIWASPTQNLEWYDQGSRRQRRIGQTAKTETITVLAEDNAVEAAVHADLQDKNNRMSHFLALVHALTQERA